MQEWLKNLALSTVAILVPIHAVMISVGVLVTMDLITGIWAAKRQGIPITSARMRGTISKLVVYQIAVLSGFLLEQYLIDGMLPAAKIVAGVIGVVEVTSILENANKILGYNLFKMVIQKIGSDNDTAKKKDQNK